MSRRATPCSSAWRWPGPRRRARATCSSGSMRSIIRAIPIAAPTSSPRSRRWPTRRPRPGSRATGFTIHAPLQHMTKADIAREAARLGLDAGISHSCYDPAPTAARAGCATPAGCAPRGSRKPACPIRRATPPPMTYAVKEAFLTLQGEGVQAGQPRGVPALCRLQSVDGARGRTGATAVCNFCDTDFVGTDGAGRGQVRRCASACGACRGAVGRGARAAAGGDHRRRADAAARCGADRCAARARLPDRGREQWHDCRRLPGIDWLCISPKAGSEVVQRRGDELKLVWPQAGIDPADARGMGLRPFPGPADGLRRPRGGARRRRSRWRWSGRSGG